MGVVSTPLGMVNVLAEPTDDKVNKDGTISVRQILGLEELHMVSETGLPPLVKDAALWCVLLALRTFVRTKCCISYGQDLFHYFLDLTISSF